MAKRLLIVLGGAAVAAFGAFSLASEGPQVQWLPECMFHRMTGLDCPGCGMTRAAHSALRGDLPSAFRFNPLGMVLVPLAMLAICLELAGWVRGKPLPWRFRPGARWIWAIGAAIFAFWVARNIPAWPFTLLGPP